MSRYKMFRFFQKKTLSLILYHLYQDHQSKFQKIHLFALLQNQTSDWTLFELFPMEMWLMIVVYFANMQEHFQDIFQRSIYLQKNSVYSVKLDDIVVTFSNKFVIPSRKKRFLIFEKKWDSCKYETWKTSRFVWRIVRVGLIFAPVKSITRQDRLFRVRKLHYGSQQYAKRPEKQSKTVYLQFFKWISVSVCILHDPCINQIEIRK